MRMLLKAMLLGCVFATSAVAGDTDVNAGLSRLAQAHIAMSKGNFDVALEHLTWCYDHTSAGGNISGIVGVRGFVIQTMGHLAPSYAPARQALKARRDAAMTKVGKPPKVVPELYDVLAINWALEDGASNHKLISELRKAGYKQFADGPQGPTPPSLSWNVVQRRMTTTYEIQNTQPRKDAVATISMSENLAILELESLEAQEQEYREDLSELQAQVTESVSEREQVRLFAEIRWLSNQLNDVIRPNGVALQTEIAYYRELSEFRAHLTDGSNDNR